MGSWSGEGGTGDAKPGGSGEGSGNGGAGKPSGGVGNPVEIEGRGSTGRTMPYTLNESVRGSN